MLENARRTEDAMVGEGCPVDHLEGVRGVEANRGSVKKCSPVQRVLYGALAFRNAHALDRRRRMSAGMA